MVDLDKLISTLEGSATFATLGRDEILGYLKNYRALIENADFKGHKLIADQVKEAVAAIREFGEVMAQVWPQPPRCTDRSKDD